MGTNEWRTDSEWPPSNTATEFYLDSDGDANTRSGNGRLTRDEPGTDSTADSYTYEPTDPVPTAGGPTLIFGVGPGVADQGSVEDREDVLVYTSEELSDPVEIAGDVNLTLFASSSQPDTDFVATLVDVSPDGTPYNVTRGVLRARHRNAFVEPESEGPTITEPEYLELGEVYELSVDAQPTAHTFREGHRIRVHITSSDFPWIAPNSNSRASLAEMTTEDFRTATQKLFHDADRPSRITLPIVE
jgi:putative CocE/NonD family hydrolase